MIREGGDVWEADTATGGFIGRKQVERPLSADRCKLAECLADVSYLCSLGGLS